MAKGSTATLKCRKCYVEAQISIVDDQITEIRCSQCAIVISGERAAYVYRESARYYAHQMAYQVFSLGNTRTVNYGGGVSVTHAPGPKPIEPDVECILLDD